MLGSCGQSPLHMTLHLSSTPTPCDVLISALGNWMLAKIGLYRKMFAGLFGNMVPSIPRWPWNFYLTEDDFDLMILLPQTPRFSDYRYEKPH